MDYAKFLSIVGQAADVDRAVAERATRATLETLAERLSIDEARAFARPLPPELLGPLTTLDRPRPFGVDEFVHRVAEREGIDVAEALRHVGVVFFALRRAMGDDGFARLKAALPQDFAPVLGDVELVPLEALVLRVQLRTGLDPDGARRAIETVLETLAQRLADGEVTDLLSRLPFELHVALKRGRLESNATSRRMSMEEFVGRVAAHEGIPADEAAERVRAVFIELRDAIGDEFFDVRSQLPSDYARLLPRP
jgi:uncharacterized protein (DUF2267 family)